jgi:hypothetical protein
MHSLETAEVRTEVYLPNRITDRCRKVVLQPTQPASRYTQTVRLGLRKLAGWDASTAQHAHPVKPLNEAELDICGHLVAG